jgi:hypothetical protein
MISRIEIVNLPEFLSAVDASIIEIPVMTSEGLRATGARVAAAAGANAPRLTGELAGGYRVEVNGEEAVVTNAAPYAGGAEWGIHGKWSGFEGAPPRYAWPAVESLGDEIGDAVLESMTPGLEIGGFAG